MIPKEVFHYTTLSTALERILFKGEIKIGQLKCTNDPKESKEHFFDSYVSSNNTEYDISNLYKRLSQTATQIKLTEWKALCVSKNHPDLTINNKYQNPFLRGNFRPTMWAHYAENHRGICLTFYGEKLDTQIKDALKDKECEIFSDGDVNYKELEDVNDDTNPEVNVDNVLNLNDLEIEKWSREYFRNNYKAIFLEKFKDWQGEYEFRWLVYSKDDSPEYIPIGNSVKEITVGCDFPEAYYQSLFKFCKDLAVPVYKMTWYNGLPDRKKVFPLNESRD